MGNELWASPVTGYRRRGTRLVELHDIIGSRIITRALYEPLQSCPADAPAWEMFQILKKRDFDVAGVREARELPIIGYVRRNQLKSGTVRDHLELITQDGLIDESLPLSSLILKFRDREFVFVKIDDITDGIITRADLNKPPVRVYLFGIVSLLEMHLSYWIRATYPGETWQKALSKQRLDDAKYLQAERRRRNQDLDLIDCLQFSDKRDLILSQKKIIDDLTFVSKRRARTKLKHAEDLRNSLAHSQYDLVRGTSWKELIELVQWMEGVINKSDNCVDQRMGQTATDNTELW